MEDRFLETAALLTHIFFIHGRDTNYVFGLGRLESPSGVLLHSRPTGRSLHPDPSSWGYFSPSILTFQPQLHEPPYHS